MMPAAGSELPAFAAVRPDAFLPQLRRGTSLLESLRLGLPAEGSLEWWLAEP